MATASRDVEILPDAAALAARAADVAVEVLAAAIAQHGEATLALAGGSTPRAMNALLAAPPRRDRVDWLKVRFFFGDERAVGPDDPDSNYRMNAETLLRPLGVPEAHVFRIHGDEAPGHAAAAYDAVLARELGPRPRFDLVLLGMGPDGHTASLFPGTLGTLDDTRRAVANRAPVGVPDRITLTPHVINDARTVLFTAGGAEKADALLAVLEGPRDPDRYPSQIVAPLDGRLIWLVDAAAAARLPRRG